jgi:hypothetical protein
VVSVVALPLEPERLPALKPGQVLEPERRELQGQGQQVRAQAQELRALLRELEPLQELLLEEA